MTVTLNDILVAQVVLNKLRSMPLTGRKAFILAKLVKAIGEEVTEFDNARNDILMKYCDKDEHGEAIVNEGSVHIQDEVLQQCNDEIQDLLAAEIELPIAALPIDWFDEIELSADEMGALMAFIEE